MASATCPGAAKEEPPPVAQEPTLTTATTVLGQKLKAARVEIMGAGYDLDSDDR